MAKCKTCRKEGAKKRNPNGTCLCKKCWNMLSEDAQKSLAKIGEPKIDKPKVPEPVTETTEKESSDDEEDDLFEDEEEE